MGIWPLVYYTTTTLEANLTELLTKENSASVAFVANDIEQNIQLRTRVLQSIASILPVDKIHDRAAMNGFLEQRKVAQELFSAGLIIIGRDGVGIADYPHVQDRDTADYRGQESFKVVIASGKPALGKPHVGRYSGIPLVSIGVPIKSKTGELVGVLFGAMALSDPGVFDQTYARLGKTGEYLVVSVKDHLFVTDTDSSHLLKPVPAPGADPLFDRYMSGYDGSGFTHSLHGQDSLTSAKHILDGRWFVIGELPQQEAFAPIAKLKQQIYTAALALFPIIAVLLWLLVHGQLRRVTEATRLIRTMVLEGTPLPLLPASNTDEVGQLLEAFSSLQQQTQRAYKEKLLLLESTGEGIYGIDADGRCTFVNAAAARMLGYEAQEMLGTDMHQLVHDRHKDGSPYAVEQCPIYQAFVSGQACQEAGEVFWRKDGTSFAVEYTANPIVDAGNIAGVVVAFSDISKRKQMEQDLRLTHTAIQNSRNAFFWVSPQGQVTYANDYACQSLGYSREELVGLHVWDFNPDFSPEDQGQVWADIKQNGMLILETRHRRKYGTIFPVEVTANHIAAEGEELTFCSVQDITVRKRAEQLLKASEARQIAIFEATPDAMLISDEHGMIVMANRQAERLLGYQINELAGLSIEILVPERSRAGHPALRAKFAAASVARPMGTGRMVQAQRKDGSEFDAEISLSPIRTTEGLLFASALRDITERKKMEAELRIAATAFESQEGMIITDADSVILRVNHAFTDITGYTAEEAVGQTPRLLQSGRHDAAFYAAMWESINRTGSWKGDIWDRRKNGEIYPKWLTITAVKANDGTVTHYVSTHVDITEHKAAQDEIKQLAFYDPLTQLPNRRLLLDRLGQTMAASKRNGIYAALMFLDLDNFKPLNDIHGHGVGDLLLADVAQRIVHCVREADTVARFGGDEFVVVLSELDADQAESTAQAGLVAEKIRAALAEPYGLTLQQQDVAPTTIEHRCTSSIGVVMFIDHEASEEDILKWADIAMYQAKEDGRNRVRFFDANP